jgi:hypothetical protein
MASLCSAVIPFVAFEVVALTAVGEIIPLLLAVI